LEDTPDVLPDVQGTGSYEDFNRTIKYLRENHNVYILAVIWGSHFEKANSCRGIENFLADLAADPEWSQRLLDTIIRKNMVMLENIAALPELDGILLGSDWGTQRDLIMSPTTWRTMIKGGEQQEYDLIHTYGKDVFVHSCGDIDRIIGDLCEMRLDVLNPVQPECMDIYKLKDTYGKTLTFYGGISTQQVLPYGSPADVAAETGKITEYMSRNGGYIIAPSQEIQADVPYENLRALIDKSREFA
jgi:uroporphyrinogen decarboxylase